MVLPCFTMFGPLKHRLFRCMSCVRPSKGLKRAIFELVDYAGNMAEHQLLPGARRMDEK